MSETPLVSVPLVTYNQAAFLPDAVEAVLSQDYPAIQLIIADDCSTDATGAYLDALEARGDPRVTVIRAETNRGVTANHVVALDACRGKYIAWMAGDDLMLPGKIAAQVALMESDPACVLCYHDLELFDSDSGQVIARFSDFDRQREGGIDVLVRHGAFNGATSNMVRAEASPGFDRSVTIASDWLYYVGCLAGGGTIRALPGVYGRYRRHRGNVTGAMARSQPRHLLEQHLQSCAIILARYPATARHVRFRMAALLRGQRWDNDGADYGEWLDASLAMHWSPKVFAARLAHRLFGIRR